MPATNIGGGELLTMVIVILLFYRQLLVTEKVTKIMVNMKYVGFNKYGMVHELWQMWRKVV